MSVRQDYQALLYGASLGPLRLWRVRRWAARTGKPMPFMRPVPVGEKQIWWRVLVGLAAFWSCTVLLFLR